MSGTIRVEDLSPQERRALLAQLLAAESAPAAGEPAPMDHPCSFGQERLWFLHQFNPATTAYNECKAVRLRGPLDVEALQRALDELYARHESLRTTFTDRHGVPMQRVADIGPLPLRTKIPQGDSPAQRLAAAVAMIRDEVALPFALACGPLIKASLHPLDAEDHILALFLHHIIMDGWSMEVVSAELARLYESFVCGITPALPPPAVQYLDFAAWQRQTFATGAMGPGVDYWKRALAGAPDRLALPTDRPRPAVQTDCGGTFSFTIEAPLADGIRAMAREHGATFFMAALAAFDVLLARRSGQGDVVVGTPTAGRPRVEAEKVVGFFANTVVLRADLSDSPTFRQLLRRVRTNCLDALSHEHVPFERLVQELAPRRDPAITPIVQVMISADRGTASDLRLPGLDSATLHIDRGAAKFDLLLLLRDGGSGAVDCEMEYRTDLFDHASIERMADDLLTLLAGAVTDPDASVATMPLLSETAIGRIARLSATAYDFGDDSRRGLHELFEAQAARTPQAGAVRFGNGQFTYAQLDHRAGQLARQLCSLGVGPDVLVGIFMDRSIELVVAMLATLKAGGAYVPIDPGYPAGRVAFMTQDSGIAVLLTQPHLRQRIPSSGSPVVCVEPGTSAAAMEGAAHAALRRAESDHLAYVMYTSGSTGRPKGVAVPHRAIVNHMLWMRRAFPPAPGERVLQKTPISFDASVWEFYAPLIGGAELVMAAPEIHRSPRDLVEAVIAHRITTLQLVPTMLEAMLDEPGLRDCTSLRRVFCGGEALATRAVARLRALLPDVEAINLYGPTEAAIDATFWPCPAEGETSAMQPIGRPIDNMRARVLDGHMNPQPIGVPGELHLGGTGLARGYINRPELTAERFVPDPHSDRPGDRLYRTGDLVRWRGDGALEFLGRLDQQVKLRGHRIEPGEIEAALAALPGIAGCAVVMREDAPGQPMLAAYLIGGRVEAASLRAALRVELPEYMIPSAFVWLDAFPRLPSGKIDRAALPAPERSIDSAPVVGPRNETERAMVEIWRQVLEVERVGIDDNFFDLGGHSLLAAQVVARVRAALGVELPLRAMFESPTIAGLSPALAHAPAAVGAAPIARIDRGPRSARPAAANAGVTRGDAPAP